MSCGGPALNAYKKKLSTSVRAFASNDETQLLHQWYAQVVEGTDLRDRVAVTGFNISRGAFGSIGAHLQYDELGTASLECSGERINLPAG